MPELRATESEIPMFKTIVWATDGSENAARALPAAKALAQQQGSKLIAVHVRKQFTSGLSAGLSLHAEEEKTGTRLRDVVDELAAEGLEAVYKEVAETGPHTAHAIADVASDEGADVIVVGTRGHTALTGLLLGSVTMRLLHVAPCPVLSIPATKQPAEQRDIEIAAVG